MNNFVKILLWIELLLEFFSFLSIAFILSFPILLPSDTKVELKTQTHLDESTFL